ncbi:MAG: glycerophosphodiester phosphodiesterase [Firmicutes bacterium]|nr:glycerophosphodiester phosphodiesterase [Bacillota bacterium]
MQIVLTIIKICFWLFFLWILLLTGRRWHPMWPEFQKYRYAHRGLHTEGAPENSIRAFERAAEKGYGAELDVHLMKDGTLAIVHDSDLERVTGKKLIIEELTLEDLEDLRLMGTDQRIPLFDQVLEIFEEKAPLIIELKTYKNNHKELVKAVLAKLDDYRGDFCVESFDYRAVALVRKMRPTICRGQLSQDFIKNPAQGVGIVPRFLATNLLTNIIAAPDFVAYRFEDRKIFANTLCCRVWRVHQVSWTIRSMEDLLTAEKEGSIPIFENFEPGAK